MNTKEVKIYKTNYTANIPTEIIEDVAIKYPNKIILVCFDLECELSELSNDESVCFGDGENFYIVLKDKS